MAYLIFSTREGEEIGRRRLDGPTSVGRSGECDVALSDPLLSRRHCRVMPVPDGRGWVLADLDSRNGTCFRGRRISSHVLRDGDVFQIGRFNVIYRAREMLTGEEPEPGLSRPRRPASPLAADPGQSTAAAFRYEPPPVTNRSVDEFPVPIPLGDDADVDLSWLEGVDEPPLADEVGPPGW